jgi:hypothetical protein
MGAIAGRQRMFRLPDGRADSMVAGASGVRLMDDTLAATPGYGASEPARN